MAATIFTAVFVALGGIFAILEHSGRQSDKSNQNIYYRFDTVDERLGVVGRQFPAVDKRLDGVDRRIDRLEAKVDTGFTKVDQRLEKVEERFDRIEATLDRKFDQIDRKVGQMTDVLHSLVGQNATSGARTSAQERSARTR